MQTVSDRWSSKELRSPRSRNMSPSICDFLSRLSVFRAGLPALHPSLELLFSSFPYSLLLGSGQSLLPSLRRETRKPYNRSILPFSSLSVKSSTQEEGFTTTDQSSSPDRSFRSDKSSRTDKEQYYDREKQYYV